MTSREEQKERRGLRTTIPLNAQKGMFRDAREKEQLFAAKSHIISLIQQNHSLAEYYFSRRNSNMPFISLPTAARSPNTRGSGIA